MLLAPPPAHHRASSIHDLRRRWHEQARQIQHPDFELTAEGNLLYRITPSGKAYDKIGKAFERLNTRLEKNDPKAHHYKFNHLRKSTNQLIREAVGRQIASDKSRLTAIEEISQMFLAQRDGLLVRLYSQTREIGSATVIYGAMNQFLATVGDDVRQAGVFDCLA